MLFGHDEGKNLKQLCNGIKDLICVKMGGTGKESHVKNSILTGNGEEALKNVPTNKGALYANAAGEAPQFGTSEALEVIGGTSKKLLWRNVSPTSEFKEQDMTIDGKYDEIIITAAYSTGYTQKAVELSLDMRDSYATGALNITWGKNVARNVEARSADMSVTVWFDTGEHYNEYGSKYTGSNSTDIYCIPLAIYGVKGVK